MTFFTYSLTIKIDNYSINHLGSIYIIKMNIKHMI